MDNFHGYNLRVVHTDFAVPHIQKYDLANGETKMVGGEILLAEYLSQALNFQLEWV